MKFTINERSAAARCGTLIFRRGEVQTPAFMPVGTYGTVKSVAPEEVAADGAEIILGNTFHLMLRPAFTQSHLTGLTLVPLRPWPILTAVLKPVVSPTWSDRTEP